VYYRINVSFTGEHFFNTGDTLTDEDAARRVFEHLLKLHPAKDGWKVDCVLWHNTGTPMGW